MSADMGFNSAFLNTTIRTVRASVGFLFRVGQNVIFHVGRVNGDVSAVGTLGDHVCLGMALSRVVGWARPNHLGTARVRPHL